LFANVVFDYVYSQIVSLVLLIMAITLPQLGRHLYFPHPELALDEPNGLLAFGGDLSVPRLIKAYQSGIFPWYSENEPLLWWSPDPRGVLFPDAFHLSKSLRKFLKRTSLRVTVNCDFNGVIAACASVPREPVSLEAVDADASDESHKTWINTDIQNAYQMLAYHGVAHSVEVWQEQQLVGGLYGVNVGQVFCGESMFHTTTNASKLALFCLVSLLKPFRHSFIDCQMQTEHLASLGTQTIPRRVFLDHLAQGIKTPLAEHVWQPRVLFEQQQWLG